MSQQGMTIVLLLYQELLHCFSAIPDGYPFLLTL